MKLNANAGTAGERIVYHLILELVSHVLLQSMSQLHNFLLFYHYVTKPLIKETFMKLRQTQSTSQHCSNVCVQQNEWGPLLE